jgi:hypothetical protein
MTERDSTLFQGLRFMRAYSVWIAGLSALILIPCFWHRRIEAGDLPSHIYNAWLCQLIKQGKVPGLYTVWQWTNVLFDFLLLYAGKLFGFVAGPKLVVAFCALVFLWGAFSLAAVASGRAPWFLTPVIAMLTYGYTFNMGFINFYLSVGLACFGLALFWRARRWDWLAGALFFGLAVSAHPMGSLWGLATLVYVLLRRKVSWLWGFTLPVLAIGLFVAGHSYLAKYANLEINWLDKPFYFFNGTDQFVLYSARTKWFPIACLTIVGGWVAYEFLEWRKYMADWKRFALLGELYLLSFCLTCLLPQHLRADADSSWMGFLVGRLTIVTAIFALCAVSLLKPKKLATTALAACAVVFFVFLYQDTGAINRLESHAERLIESLPYGTLVIPTVGDSGARIPFIGHVIDRACIGHCFTYSNYEAPSGQFRLRARPGSPVITSSFADSQEMEGGDYVVKASDLPLVNIYQCDPSDFTILCARNLVVGDTSGPQQENDPDQ